MKQRYYVIYEGRDPTDATICRVLNGFGGKRSEVVKALLFNAANRYGWEVMQKKNVNILLYLLRTDIGKFTHADIQPMEIGFSDTRAVRSDDVGNTPALSAKEQLLFPDEVTQASEKPSSAEIEPTPSMPDNKPLQASLGSLDADQIRRNLVDYLNNGFYDQEGE